MEEIREQISEQRAKNFFALTEIEWARQDYLRAPAPVFHRYVSAKIDYDSRIVSLIITPQALAGYDCAELSTIITNVLRRSRQHMISALKEPNDALHQTIEGTLGQLTGRPVQSVVGPAFKPYEEVSHDGHLRIVINSAGEPSCCIDSGAVDPENAALLADRIVTLHNAALKRRDLEWRSLIE